MHLSGYKIELNSFCNTTFVYIDAYNNRNQANEGLQPAGHLNASAQPVSQVASELSHEIEAYYGNTPVETGAPDDRNVSQASPMANRLASEITTYNRTNGSQID